MTTTVINRRVNPELEEVYIGRGSKWGNPFTHKKGTTAKYVVATREEAVEKYRAYFLKKVELMKSIHELKGKRIGCYCDPEACHGHVLAEYADAFLLVVAGSRGFDDFDMMCSKLDRMLSKIKKKIVIISGTANGADKLGEKYAKLRGYDCFRLPAEWGKFGKRAGMMRNADMAKIGTAAALFWDGVSPGTKGMIDLCKKYELQTRIVRY